MKNLAIVVVIVGVLYGCKKEEIEELPDKVIILQPCDSLARNLKLLLPEYQDFFLSNADFFSDTVQKKIVLTKESEVYVSFIDEGAGFRNSLCWYSYNKLTPPSKNSDLKGNVAFPNISKVGQGGPLEPGYTMQLGTEKFPAGTVIGFFLVVNGWNDGSINYDRPLHYTNFEFNVGARQQHILFKISACSDLVIGFEDSSLEDPKCDKDFNDIIFSVLDNKEGLVSTSFDIDKVVVE